MVGRAVVSFFWVIKINYSKKIYFSLSNKGKKQLIENNSISFFSSNLKKQQQRKKQGTKLSDLKQIELVSTA